MRRIAELGAPRQWCTDLRVAVCGLWLRGTPGVGSCLSAAQFGDWEGAQYLVHESRVWPSPLLLGKQDTV